MEVVQLFDPADFLERAEPLLLADEARHNLILGLAGTLRDHPHVYPESALWLSGQGGPRLGAAPRPTRLHVQSKDRCRASSEPCPRWTASSPPGARGQSHAYARRSTRCTPL